MPTNGLMLIGYTANVKCSVAEAGRVALFLGANQIKIHSTGPTPIAQEVEELQTTLREVHTCHGGLRRAANESGAYVTTGQILGDPERGALVGFRGRRHLQHQRPVQGDLWLHHRERTETLGRSAGGLAIARDPDRNQSRGGSQGGGGVVRCALALFYSHPSPTFQRPNAPLPSLRKHHAATQRPCQDSARKIISSNLTEIAPNGPCTRPSDAPKPEP